MADRLPIDAVMPEILAAMRRSRNLVLRAPPGAGKTTRVGPAMLDAKLVGPKERILMLEPRRVAARAAARRIAEERKGRVGDEIGYQVRFDDKTSTRTRFAILTEGLLTKKLESDPTLEGVGAVLLDEFHERSVHADLALAFLREVQETLRPELRIVVMSATLEAGPIAEFLGGAEIVDTPGRIFPVRTTFIDATDDRRIEARVVSGVRQLVTEDDDGGDILVFLPGVGEIRRSQEALEQSFEQRFLVCPLYGDLSPDEQDRALKPGKKRKVVLATNVAETSLTIEGVSAVVDTGLVKRIFHDPARGIDRLELGRISRASADQRRGRAGRTGPGRCLRLWTEPEDRRLVPHDEPELMRVDLAPVLLDVLGWGARDPAEFEWFEPPPKASLERALQLLRILGAIETHGFRLTPHGELLRRFPLHPRLTTVLVRAHKLGVVREAALVAALLSERDLVRRSNDPFRASIEAEGPSDPLHRRDLYLELEASGFSRSLAGRLNLDLGAARTVRDVERRLIDLVRREMGEAPEPKGDTEVLLRRALLAGFADRVAKRREPGSSRLLMSSGRGGELARESVVRTAPLMVAIELDDSSRAGVGTADTLVRQASAVEEAWLSETGIIEEIARVRWNDTREAAEAVLERRYGALVLAEKRDPDADPVELARVLAEVAQPKLLEMIGEDAHQILLRFELIRKHVPDLGIEGIEVGTLLPKLCLGLKSLAELRKLDFGAAIKNAVGYGTWQKLESLAPERIEVPSGSQIKLRYEHDGPPVLSVRLQEVFGLEKTPKVANGRVAVKMELLAPNMRPVQVTQDLESFWARAYVEVRKDMRARYPRHAWPEDGRTAPPQRRPARRKR